MSYLKGSENMAKQQKRRHITINDELYKQVSIEAAKKDVNKGNVIEEALKKYFGGEERQG
jgi:hypothetical protein